MAHVRSDEPRLDPARVLPAVPRGTSAPARGPHTFDGPLLTHGLVWGLTVHQHLKGALSVRTYKTPAWEVMDSKPWAADFRELCRLYYKPVSRDKTGTTITQNFPPRTRGAQGVDTAAGPSEAAKRVLEKYRMRTRGKYPKAQERWHLLYNQYILPRLIAFYLRRTFRLRDPQRGRRLGAFIKSDAEEKRRKFEAEQETKRREEMRQKRMQCNMVRRSSA